ncbi:E3 ubiquitin-protein ligase SH3RF1 isoform X1 [Fundulus heteroclitus]|uniref:E3 ubiquitin-protein ligase SH3RF1 isoform X1 n=1 Tax=Fundulus heteroclitus TaxID=8078 RepID=UPI00165BDACE|nr:E3 ubiquitin-protein ligase SH3RF1 isoform X1 [Fundulus heteroclitus]XP_012711329.2 E3 ubiquitin-protein ligase SH3RF1 isoform X1 [Fundulus heteroclitus]XP_021168231.2 E3 ubiquitin-protein ligase SH3RF1 isoform X1 [Fundulus heteroclitus]XP_021168300.2 E3 ubiquitin-protein ligase SH3RF1 isoform X1 [Fundulus heteroclitus]
MVDYSLSDGPGSMFSFESEQVALISLLECPLCFERLDASAKVLPCQHTFCLPCLERHQVAQSQLFCPECLAPVPVRTVVELPENLLLVRLLEGLQGLSGPGGRSPQKVRYAVAADRGIFEDQQQGSQQRERQGYSEAAFRASASNHRADASREPVFTPANGAPTSHKAEDNRHGQNGSDGHRASLGALQAGGQAPQLQPLHQQQQQPLCRALCDFNPEEMDVEDSQYYLSFLKGDILTAVRRVDEHWIEARLGEKVGICPRQFIEPNSAAAKLLKGKGRSGSDSAEPHHQSGSGGQDKAADAPARSAHYGVPQVQAKTPAANAVRKQPAVGSSNGSFQPSANISASNSFGPQGQPQHFSAPPAAQGRSNSRRLNSRRTSRRSDPHRLHSQSEKMSNETPSTFSMALMNPQMASTSADSKNSSTQQLSISVCAVLYSYKPRRPEELELRKGEMVGVYGKFKEGWLRGLSLRTGKVGILPGNYIAPVLRTSARLLDTKAANASSHYNTVSGKKPTTAKSPTVVLALDRVGSDGTKFSSGQVSSMPNGAQHAVSSSGAAKPSFYGTSQGWDSVRRIFNPQRAANRPSHMSSYNSQPFAQVQASGYSPALQRKRNSSFPSNYKPYGWMTEPAAPSAAAFTKDRDFGASQEAAFHHHRQSAANAPQSILVKPDSQKNGTDKPPKSVRFLTDEESPPPPRHRTSSWSSGSQVHPNCRPGSLPLEVWAPSLTMGRDGPGIILREGKGPVLRKGFETPVPDLNSNPQKPFHSQPSLSALSAQFSPIRHRVTTTHLAQTDSELSLLQGEVVLVHRPRPDGRILLTQESSGQTGIFHNTILQALERLS